MPIYRGNVAGPSAAATVSDETTFGIAKNAGVSATFSKGDHTHGTPAASAINIFRGITPIAALFTTNPTTLSNTTDGDFSTVTGTGTKVMAAGGSWGTLTYDLGSVKTVLMGARVGLWTSASSCYIFFESSNDNITWTATGIEDSVIQTLAAAEQISDSLSQILTGRYLRLRFHTYAAATCNCKIYEVYGWPLVI